MQEHRHLPVVEVEEYPRPQTREACQEVERPCPYVGCRYHLYLDVLPSGSIKFNFPDLEPDELEVSCSLDVADDGDHSLEQVGVYLNLTRERARQLEDKALRILRQRRKGLR